MGSLFQAHDLRLDIDVAVKLVRSDLAGPEATERLLNEGRTLAHITHPSAVRVIDVSEADHSGPFLVMELLRGTSLAEALAVHGRFTAEEAVRLLLPIVDVAAEAHAQGIVHRDIKPHNIVLAEGKADAPLPKLVDFGIARRTAEPVASRLTQEGALLGSLEYMAPEQAEGSHDVGPEADVWALCVVLFELITGKTPFHGPTPAATLAAIRSSAPAPLDLLSDEPGLADILRWGLAKDRAERWSTARELGHALAWWAIARGIESDFASTSLSSRWGTSQTPPRFEPEPPPRSREGRRPTVLMADDDPLQRAAVRAVLQEEGYDVVVASDGEEALKLLESAAEAPDVLLLDFQMPGYSGLDVLRQLHKHGRVPPTFILTGFHDSSVDRMAEQLGARRVIHKPVDLNELCSEIRRALAG